MPVQLLEESLRLDALALCRHSVVRGVAKMPAEGTPHASINTGMEWLLRAIGGDHAQLEERRARENAEHKASEDKRRAEQRAAFSASQAARRDSSPSPPELNFTYTPTGSRKTPEVRVSGK
jgi:hypothetical protein